MKKLLLIVLLMLLCACNENQQDGKINIIAPKGAPAIGLLGFIKQDPSQITTVDGSDALIAAFTQKQSEYDMIVAPINLGCNLISKNATDYRLIGVITWGNLYLVENTEMEETNLVCFGQGAVPGKIIESIDLQYSKDWLNSVADVATALLANKYKYGILAEPVLTKVLSKNDKIQISVNLQEEYGKLYGVNDYPQAAIFVKEDTYTDNKKLFKNICNSISKYEYEIETTKADLDEIGENKIGVSSSLIDEKTIERLNIRFDYADDVKKEIEAFLKLFGIDDISKMIIR